jgi:hypothetical protein
MAEVEGLTKARMLEIEAACIVDGAVVLNNLILTRHDGTTIDAGNVRGAQGIQGVPGPNGITPVTSVTRPAAPYHGQHIYETDTDLAYVWDGAAWVQTNLRGWKNWVYAYSNLGAMTIVPVAHAANHARYMIVEKTCFVSFSQVITLGGTIQQVFDISLPVNAAFARQTFAGFMQNNVVGATSSDSTTDVTLRGTASNPWVAGNWHACFQGSYEIA